MTTPKPPLSRTVAWRTSSKTADVPPHHDKSGEGPVPGTVEPQPMTDDEWVDLIAARQLPPSVPPGDTP